MNPRPFSIQIPQAALDDLRQRLARTRWPDEVAGAGWDYGTNLGYLRRLGEYWEREYDWRAQEAAINRFAGFKADVDGFGLHFIHERSSGPAPLPVLVLHGWPGSFYQMIKLAPLLTDPGASGADGADSFDVVIGSLPGFGFSDRPAERGMNIGRMAELFHTLMTRDLGYSRYAVRGSDLGAGVCSALALTHPEAIVGYHTGGTYPWVQQVPDDLSEAEQAFVANAQQWSQTEMAYAMLQASKPQTLAFGLNDSPAGLASWIIEKWRTWSDCDGDVERVFSRDELLTNVSIYWFTETIGSSVRLYYEAMHTPVAGRWDRAEVPTAMAMPPKDMFPTPREWVERTSRVDRWTELPRGGHFPEMEVPDLIAADMRDFFRPLR